jgi:hypothetical protein
MKPFFLLLLPILLLTPAFAQNSDLGILVGVAPVKVENTIGPAGISNTVNATFQIDYAVQVALKKSGAFYVELPFAVVSHVENNVSSSISDSVNAILFFTPGVRWKMFVQSRVSVYAALGGGFASFGSSRSEVGRQITHTSSNSFGPALDFGGGVDFRLTRLLSLRAEIRDYLTRSQAGGIAGHNHAAFDLGIGFHF